VVDTIGELNDGWNVARTTLLHERASAAAGKGRGMVTVEAGQGGGNLHRAVGELVDDARRASADPAKRADLLLSSRLMRSLATDTGADADPARRDQLMRYHVHSEVYRLNGQRIRDLARARVQCPLDGSTAKLDLAMLAHESRDLSLAMLGADSMLMEGDARVQRAGLSSFIPSLGGGTNEIQRNIIAERTLGLPREPGNDNDVPFRELRRS
jgi:alkylation response protein AidB-like acyl-CoA dehydrogenase